MVIVVAFKATAETLVGGEGAEMSKVITLLFNSLKKKKTKTKTKTKKRIESTLTIGVKKPETLFLHEILLLYKDKISTMT